jgi:natural product biosynthesis luciferase-like monooxygenase protein
MQTQSFSCYVIGGDSLLLECAELLVRDGHSIRGVISDNPRIAQWATKGGIPHLPVAGYEAALTGQDFEYLFAITHLSIVPDSVLKLPKRGSINFHDGPLPRYAGLHAPAWALMAGEPRYGITWHWITPGVDEGDILEQREFDVAPSETSLTINTKCFEAGMESFADLIKKLASQTTEPRPQDRSQRSYYAKHDRPRAASALDFAEPAQKLDALIRALDFGQYDNPLANAKVLHGGRAVLVLEGSALTDVAAAAPGSVLAVDDGGIQVATGHGAIVLRKLATARGEPLTPAKACELLGVSAGGKLDPLAPDVAERLTALGVELARSEATFIKRLATLDPIQVPFATDTAPSGDPKQAFELPIPAGVLSAVAPLAGADAAAAVVLGFLSKLGGKAQYHVSFSEPALSNKLSGLPKLAASSVPLRVVTGAATGAAAGGDGNASLATLAAKLGEELTRVRKLGTYWLEAPARRADVRARPELRNASVLPVGIALSDSSGSSAPIVFVVDESGSKVRVEHDPKVLGEREARALQRQLGAFLQRAAEAPSAPLSEIDLLSPDEQRRLLVEWNQTQTDYPRDACIHTLVEQQAKRTPDAPAVTFEGTTITYRQLDERSNKLAAFLRELGVVPDQLVGVCVERSIDLVVSIVGVQKAGGAYVPLDPAYPRERLALMIEDSGASVLLTQRKLVSDLPSYRARLICVDADWPEIEKRSAAPLTGGASPSSLAYVIYTSGSTGKPKGVMIEHRNAVNFFTGMDPIIAHDPPGTWLAVTSLSFDISVLELLWTLTRGFHVVVFLDRDRAGQPSAVVPAAASSRKLDFSIFLWGSEDTVSTNKYRLMLDSARFADTHGFSAVWTPERHFHAFGGPYPNPSVTGAAIAACTQRLQVRAGSCVVPLHHPVRVAEEWAVIDNLTNGRAGISFAAGWQPDDFLLRPESFKDAKKVMAESIETVRKLWRGEKLKFPGPLGKDVEITTQPRPIQKELPYWVTTAGNADTYRLAGKLGANVLTHLLGQTVEEVAGKIKVYREARAEAGFDPNTGIVSLMLHTFVGDDVGKVREIVREPMKAYLRSSVSLIKGFAWAFPAFKRPQGENASPNDIDLGSLTSEELDAILEFAFERYFETSGLFGTPESCQAMIERCRAAGVDDIACLIDFGVPVDIALAALEKLDVARQTAVARNVHNDVVADTGDYSIGAQIVSRKATHLQCTPSMARMLIMDESSRRALGSIKHVMIGGEAFPVALARDLASAMGEGGTITNMYGPTETTIWSSTQRVTLPVDSIPIGRPIANTQLYVLDDHKRPVPVGVPGELYIGGDGVVRGYLNRPELTSERFVADPFRVAAGHAGARMYRTGDLARFREDGVVEFLGRADFQVKIRGYRIELGEIETALGSHTSVREGVVVAREDTPGDQRLVGYIVPKDAAPDVAELREYLRGKLPEYMVPSHIVVLERLPLTPNGKVDRKQLPAPDAGGAASAKTEFVAPTGELEEQIAAAWRETLGLDRVGIQDNFFDLGGHSLLVVRLHRRLKESLPKSVSLTDLYRFPTIGSLSEYLSADPTAAVMGESADRAKLRREMLDRRRRRPS